MGNLPLTLLVVRSETLVLLGIVLLMPARLPAEETPLESIEVTGEPVSEAERKAPTAFVTVIEPTLHTEQMESAADALGESVGTQVRRFGGLGAFSLISIRGSNPNQVRIYLDGIPLSRASDETVDLSSLPLDSLERIEVYRGTVPVAFGVRGTAGVINLVTKPPAAEPATELGAGFGSFLTRKVVASHSQTFGDVGFFGHVTYLGSKGDFTFLDDRGTDQNPTDDTEATRENNAFNSLDAVLKGSYELPADWTLDLTSETFYKAQGIPGVGSNQSLDSSLDTLRAVNFLRGASPQLLEGMLELAGTVFAILDRETFSDPKGELFGVVQETLGRTTAFGGTMSGTSYALPNQAIGWFTELSHERFVQVNALQDSDSPAQDRLDFVLAAQDRVGFFDDMIVLVPSLGYEHLDDRISSSFDPVTGEPSGPKVAQAHDFFNPAIGAEVRPWPWLALKGNLGRYQRAPNFSELFGNAGVLVGNDQLKPETVVDRDIGFAVSWAPPLWVERLALEYAYFNNDADDLITPVQVSGQRFTFQNIGAARVRGNEVGFHGTALGHAGLDVNYTNQDGKNLSDKPEQRGQPLPFLPENELYLRLQGFDTFGTVYYEFNFVSGNFTTNVGFDELPSRDIHTLGFQVRAWQPFTVSFEARNITNNQIVDLADFPLPGLSFFGTVAMQF